MPSTNRLPVSRPLQAALVLLLFVIVGFATEPRPVVGQKLVEITRPGDIDAYVTETESRFADLREGTEKLIIRHPTAKGRKTPLAVVYLHAFSASRQELSPVPEQLAKRLGANLLLTRLSGHGSPGDALGYVTVEDWLTDAVEASQIGRALGDRVLLMGTSTEGTLAA
ncbi:MAG: hypothetical protein JSW48_15555 [Betaproteobacteria bacterium]|nr:MAG: hypothetical protein JSW48_15555 [Betaproteobacteria bacterium]